MIVRLELLVGDTDSLFFETRGVDMIGTLFPQMLRDGLLDTSNYDKSHPMYSEKHKAELGCIKDEFCGHACQEFILLRPKSYSMKMYGNNSSLDKKKSKGVARRKIKLFTHEDFRNVFFNQVEISTNNRRMQTIKHVVYNVEQRKIALSYADDKRAWYSNNFSLPYGYCDAEFYNDINDDETIIKKDKMCIINCCIIYFVVHKRNVYSLIPITGYYLRFCRPGSLVIIRTSTLELKIQ